MIKYSVYGYVACVCAYRAIFLLPLSIAMSIMQCTAFVSSIMSYLFGGQSLSFKEIVSIIFGIIGCIMLTNPELFTQKISMSHIVDQANPTYYIGLLYAIMFTILKSLKIMNMSELGSQLPSCV